MDRTHPAPVRLVRGIDRWEACRWARPCCDWRWWACPRPPIRLQYWEYLERQNIAFADVSPGLLPRENAPRPQEAPKGAEASGLSEPRPSYAMPHLGDIPPPSTPEIVRRVEITYRREVLDASGVMIDVFV